ncbi:unnamed protein product [Cylicostephanus goldi]|uniref:Anoctamin n=1 Tax=Cylicostephanus goldi TaxID=71465 RepID=A0A3P6UPV6_CYLGO|nr:unnamed protein product [Cylicostephanus goldi]
MSITSILQGFQQNGLFGLGADFKDVCLPGTCGSLLAVQLITHMLIKPLPKFTSDIIIPSVVRIFRLRKWYHQDRQDMKDMLNEGDETNVLVREWLKPKAEQFTQGEFNEKIILFGTTMMFAALFPLAPLIALIIGLIDLRIDALRLLWFNRRPIPVMAQDSAYREFLNIIRIGPNREPKQSPMSKTTIMKRKFLNTILFTNIITHSQIMTCHT